MTTIQQIMGRAFMYKPQQRQLLVLQFLIMKQHIMAVQMVEFILIPRL